MQAARRTAQARRHAVDRRRRQRHHRPALLQAQPPLRGFLGATSRKRRLKRHLTNLTCTREVRIIHPDARLVAGRGGRRIQPAGRVGGSDPGTPAETENLNARPSSPACQPAGCVMNGAKTSVQPTGEVRRSIGVGQRDGVAGLSRRDHVPAKRSSMFTRVARPRRPSRRCPGGSGTRRRRSGSPRLDVVAVGQVLEAARRCSPRPPALPTLLRESRCRLVARLTAQEGRFSVVPERTRLGG